mgnify:CR=1 FL=1
MALIDSLEHTTLKDFPKYTGYQPLIRKDIKNPPIYNSVSKQVEARGDDVLRLSKLMVTGPGIKFMGNVATLNAIDKGRSAAPLQRGRLASSDNTSFGDVLSFIGAVFASAGQLALNTVAITAETIAQAGLAGSGTHLVLGFKGKQGYLRRQQGHVFSSQGKEVPIPNSFVSELRDGDSKTFDQNKLKYGNRHSAKDYAYDQPRNGISTEDPLSNIVETLTSQPSVKGDRKLYDFTSKEYKVIESKIVKEERLGLGRTAGRGLSRYTANYTSKSPETARDKINMMGPHTGENFFNEDFIKFNFEVIDPDEGEENTFLYFRAYLDSFSDSYTGNWNAHKYLGRGEDFHTYGGFSRAISFGFKSAVMTREELKPMYHKLNVLASTTAPTYHSQQSFMRGTIVNVTIGDYLVSQPGFFSAVNYTWNTTYPWETKLNPHENTQQLPHILDCALTFTPIHTFAPQTGNFHYSTNPSDNKFFKQDTAIANLESMTEQVTGYVESGIDFLTEAAEGGTHDLS